MSITALYCSSSECHFVNLYIAASSTLYIVNARRFRQGKAKSGFRNRAGFLDPKISREHVVKRCAPFCFQNMCYSVVLLPQRINFDGSGVGQVKVSGALG